VWSSKSRDHVLWSHGRFISSGVEFSVANVYAPCEDGAKQRLWASLTPWLQSLGRRRICVCGDFNVVKHVDERHSSRLGHMFLDHIPFSRFIEDNSLVDLPLHRHKFTWSKWDGLSKSRVDRFMLSEEWCLDWHNCKQVARLRGLSNHYALVLSESEEDWGPRPSKMLKCWRDISCL
jgi:exonuclease III